MAGQQSGCRDESGKWNIVNEVTSTRDRGENCGKIPRYEDFIISTQQNCGQCLGLIFSLLQPIINESFLCWIRRYVCSVKFCIDRDWYWYACIKLPLLHCEEQIIFMHIEVKHQISSFDGSCHCHCMLFSRLWNIVIIWWKINEWKVFSPRTANIGK